MVTDTPASAPTPDPGGPQGVRQAFDGRVIRVDVETWPGHGSYDVVHHIGAAAVLPLTPEGEVVLVEQFRPPIRSRLTEIPAGLLDREDEDPLTCAARELFEETGYRHEAIEFLTGYYPSAGFTDEYVHLFWARTQEEPVGEPEQGIRVVRMPLDRMVAAARAGRVRDVKTALALLLVDARAAGP